MSDTRLQEAVRDGEFDKVRELVGEGVDVNSDDADLGTAVYQAINSKNLEILKFLIEETEADVNGQAYNNTFPPLHTTIIKNFVKGFDFLLGVGSLDINHRNKEGMTAMHYAIKHRRTDMGKKIINHPYFNPDVENDRRRTPLMDAIVAENEDLVYLLLNHPDGHPERPTALHESPAMLAANCRNQRIRLTVEDKVLPHFLTTIGKVLKDNGLRHHCERMHYLKLKEVEDIDKLEVDDKYLSWKGNVNEPEERAKMLQLFEMLKNDPNSVLLVEAVPVTGSSTAPVAKLV